MRTLSVPTSSTEVAAALFDAGWDRVCAAASQDLRRAVESPPGAKDSPTPAEAAQFESAFRDVMAGVCTPVSVVTAVADGVPHGTTVSAFASLSMKPRMILVSLDARSELLSVIRETGRFGLNVLSSRQAHTALQFARKTGTDRFADVAWEVHGGVPRLPDLGGFLVCEVANVIPGGDHFIVLGSVVTAQQGSGAPLTYHARSFGTHAPHDAA